ncbi:MAG: endonuclease III [Chlamydiae bacterium]|nr:endonuclease III [Chlamydiota bacterium]
MKRKEKASFILDTLNRLFPNPAIPLSHTNSFTLLIAVLLSAQSTDERVNKITPFLFAKATSPLDMVTLSISEIEEMIKTCGLWRSKAKAIWNLSKILVEKHEGKVPDTLEVLETLPGVGHKTASVVMIQAFNIPAFPIDTHIHRCAKRWGLTKGKTVAQTEKDLKAIFPKNTWIKLHLQIIYFARKFCPARGHVIESCPICNFIAKTNCGP